MCEFKPGDEVVCVDADSISSLILGATYTIKTVFSGDAQVPDRQGRPFRAPFAGVTLYEVALPDDQGVIGWKTCRFRKVQRRDLSAWLKTATKFEEPKRKKANA